MSKILIIIVVLLLIAGGAFFFISKGNQDVVYQQDLKEPEAVVPQPGAAAPKTEVRASGFNAEVTVSPSVDNVVSGVVTVTISKSPVGTKITAFAISGGDLGDSMHETGPNLGFDSDASDGWTKLVDTTQYKNGLYEISGIAAESMNDNPLGVATAQVVIQN